jgi:hypothetical protein
VPVPRRVAALLLAAASLTALTGCGAGDGETVGRAAEPPTITAPGAASGAATTSGGAAVEVCDLLPVTTVAQVSGLNIAEATPDDSLASTHLYRCEYTSADGAAIIAVSVLQQGAADVYAQQLEAAGSTAQMITGLGDKAFAAVDGVHALFGDTEIVVAGLPSDDASAALVRDLQAAL